MACRYTPPLDEMDAEVEEAMEDGQSDYTTALHHVSAPLAIHAACHGVDY